MDIDELLNHPGPEVDIGEDVHKKIYLTSVALFGFYNTTLQFLFLAQLKIKQNGKQRRRSKEMLEISHWVGGRVQSPHFGGGGCPADPNFQSPLSDFLKGYQKAPLSPLWG